MTIKSNVITITRENLNKQNFDKYQTRNLTEANEVNTDGILITIISSLISSSERSTN